MANKRYGIKEVADVTFFDINTNKPVLFFDTLKVSTIENESESAEATGGQGNSRLLSWDYGRTATVTMQDALLSDASLAMLSGNDLVKEDIEVSGKEQITVAEDLTIELKEDNVEGLSLMKVINGVVDPSVDVTFTESAGTITIDGGAKAGETVMAFYKYVTTNKDAAKVNFSANSFPGTYRVVGDTIANDQQGNVRKMQFVIPQAKLQSAFTLTMDVENVSVFDFNLDVLVDPETNTLYDIITL